MKEILIKIITISIDREMFGDEALDKIEVVVAVAGDTEED